MSKNENNKEKPKVKRINCLALSAGALAFAGLGGALTPMIKAIIAHDQNYLTVPKEDQLTNLNEAELFDNVNLNYHSNFLASQYNEYFINKQISDYNNYFNKLRFFS